MSRRKAIQISDLQLPLDDHGRVLLRTGPRTVSAIQEITELMTQENITKVIRFIGESNVNLSWLVRYHQKKRIFSVSPRLKGLAWLPNDLAIESGFLNPMKYPVMMFTSNEARRAGVPCPQIMPAGFVPVIKRGFAFQELARGTNLNTLWPEMSLDERIMIMRELGTLVARMHQATLRQCDLDHTTHHEWYRRRIRLANQWLIKQAVITPETAQSTKQALESLLAQLPATPLALVHTDLTLHNLFVKRIRGRYQITDIIDWETAIRFGPPWYDVLLSAWWNAGEDAPNNEPVIFRAVLEAYNEQFPELTIPSSMLDLLLKLVDLTWYINVLPFTCLREKHRERDRLNASLDIVKKIRTGKLHLPISFQF